MCKLLMNQIVINVMRFEQNSTSISRLTKILFEA